MTAAHKAAKAWYDARAGNDVFVDTEERREFREDMVRRLTGHLEPFVQAEVERVAGPLVEALEHIYARSSPASSAPPFDVIAFRGHIATILHNYRKETNK